MKHSYLFILLLSILFSCQNDEVDNLGITPNNLSTRATETDPISQFYGVEVNIIAREGFTDNYRYLSVNKNTGVGVLSASDTGSGLERWIINPNKAGNGHTLKVVGTIQSGRWFYKNVNERSVIPTVRTSEVGAWKFTPVIADNKTYYNLNAPEVEGATRTSWKMLLPRDFSSHEVELNIGGRGGRGLWEIIPSEDFIINNIKYEISPSDVFSVTPILLDSRSLENNTPTPAIRTLTFTETASNTSKFSKNEGFSVTIKGGTEFKVDIPLFASGKINTEVTSATSWTYTTETTNTITNTFTESIQQEVPAYTTYNANFIASKYEANITYTAELIGVKTQSKMYVKGKWKGVIVKESKTQIYDPNGKLVRTIAGIK